LKKALTTHLPAHVRELGPVVESGVSDAPLDERALKAAFEKLPSISIDKGVMEKLSATMCVKAEFDWSDVGSFPALAPHLDKDGIGNAARGRLRARDAAGNVVWCEDEGEVVALVGVSDLVVVRAGNRTLVAPIAKAEEIKKLVEGLPPNEQ
jgi:mannose-1-phosphate guanylyltransferase